MRLGQGTELHPVLGSDHQRPARGDGSFKIPGRDGCVVGQGRAFHHHHPACFHVVEESHGVADGAQRVHLVADRQFSNRTHRLKRERATNQPIPRVVGCTQGIENHRCAPSTRARLAVGTRRQTPRIGWSRWIEQDRNVLVQGEVLKAIVHQHHSVGPPFMHDPSGQNSAPTHHEGQAWPFRAHQSGLVAPLRRIEWPVRDSSCGLARGRSIPAKRQDHRMAGALQNVCQMQGQRRLPASADPQVAHANHRPMRPEGPLEPKTIDRQIAQPPPGIQPGGRQQSQTQRARRP